MKSSMFAIIKKDFRGITANKRLFSAILIVPLILTIFLPSIFVFLFYSTVTDFARLRGWSTSQPRAVAA